MLRLRYTKKGQTLVEYCVMLLITMVAFLTIGNYFKRGVQGRWKQAIDDMGDQYDPRTAVSTGSTAVTHRLNSVTDTLIYAVDSPDGRWTNREDVIRSTETRTGTLAVGAY